MFLSTYLTTNELVLLPPWEGMELAFGELVPEFPCILRLLFAFVPFMLVFGI